MKLLTPAELELEYTILSWFNRLELHAKGHPLSRIARQM
jgi:hypothetical protein